MNFIFINFELFTYYNMDNILIFIPNKKNKEIKI